MGKRAYTRAHEISRQSSKQEMQRYDGQFRPLVGQARDQALNWDTDQRQQANVDRSTNSVRFGLRKLQRGAGANVKDIIQSGTTTGDVMANSAVQGNQVTGWQKLKKLGNVAAHARHQKGVVDSGMMSYGNMESSMNQTKAAIDEHLKSMRYQMVGQAAGTAAGMYAGGWWSGGGSGVGTGMVDGAGGGIGTGNVGASELSNRINGTGMMVG